MNEELENVHFATFAIPATVEELETLSEEDENNPDNYEMQG